MKAHNIIAAAALASCGTLDVSNNTTPPAAAPGRVQGCAGLGYALSASASACSTLSRLTATPADLARACASGWAACSSPPAGCEDLPAYYLGSLAWRPVGGTDAAGGCGATPQGAIPVGLGCGAGAQREVAPRCGGWDRAADLPWGRGVLCCRVGAP